MIIVVDAGEDRCEISSISMEKSAFFPGEIVNGTFKFFLYSTNRGVHLQIVIGVEDIPKQAIELGYRSYLSLKTTEEGISSFSFPAPNRPGNYSIKYAFFSVYGVGINCPPEDQMKNYPNASKITLAYLEVKSFSSVPLFQQIEGEILAQKSNGLNVTKIEMIMNNAEEEYYSGNYSLAVNLANKAKVLLQSAANTEPKAFTEINRARDSIIAARYKGLVVSSAELILLQANQKYLFGEYEDALVLALEAQRNLELIMDMATYASNEIDMAMQTITSEIEKGYDIPEAEKVLTQANQSYNRGEYDASAQLATQARILALDIDGDGVPNDQDYAPSLNNNFIYLAIIGLIFIILTFSGLKYLRCKKERQLIDHMENASRLATEAKLFFDSKNFKDSKTRYEQARKEFELANIVASDLENHNIIKKIEYEISQIDRAIINAMDEMKKEEIELYISKANMHLSEAKDLYSKGQYKESKKACDLADKECSFGFGLLWNEASEMVRDLKQRIQDVSIETNALRNKSDTALKIDAGNSNFEYAVLCMEKKDFIEAKSRFEMSLNFYSEAKFIADKGQFLKDSNTLQEKIDEIKIRTIDASCFEAERLLKNGNYDEAIKFWEEALVITHDSTITKEGKVQERIKKILENISDTKKKKNEEETNIRKITKEYDSLREKLHFGEYEEVYIGCIRLNNFCDKIIIVNNENKMILKKLLFNIEILKSEAEQNLRGRKNISGKKGNTRKKYKSILRVPREEVKLARRELEEQYNRDIDD